MANATSFSPGSPAPIVGPSWSPTQFDELLLPDGRRVGSVESHTLRTEFDRLQIPGFSHSLGRLAAIELYAAHLGAIAKTGADKAIAEWLETHRA